MFDKQKCSENGLKDRLGIIRANMALSQKKMAQKLGVTEKTVTYYEKGITKPDYLKLCDYAEIGGVSPNFLFGYGIEEGNRNLLNNLQEDINKVEILKKIDELTKEELDVIVYIIRFFGK